MPNYQITTKVRPIRKLFVIDPDQVDLLWEIIQSCSQEVMGHENLILLSNSISWANVPDMIKTSDPDIIINFSATNKNNLEKVTGLKVIEGNNPRFNLKRLSTDLKLFNNIEPFIKKHEVLQTLRPLYFNGNLDDSELNKCFLINAGLATKELLNAPIMDIYSKSPLLTMEDLIHIAKEPHQNFLNSCAIFHSNGRGFSIWEVNHNPEGFFQYGDNNSTLFVGSLSNIEGILYFWNCRALYPMHRCLWITDSLLKPLLDIEPNWTHFVNVSTSLSIIQEFNRTKNIIEIPPVNYYFDNYLNEWEDFEHFQTTFSNGDDLTLTHPNEKLFSKNGYNIAITLEIRGLDISVFPSNSIMGDEIIQPSQFYPEAFVRVSKVGLAVYHTQFEPERDSGLYQSIKIPTESILINAYLRQFEPELRFIQSEKAITIERLMVLAGDRSGIEMLRNPRILDLFVKLTPKRLSRLVTEIKKLLGESPVVDNISDFFQESQTSIVTLGSDIVADLERIFTILNIKASEKKDFANIIESLWNRGFLLRGRSFKCSVCKRDLWFPLQALQQVLQCYCCNSVVHLPVFDGMNASSDSFKLNELVAAAIDQGQFSVALTVAFLQKQRFYLQRFKFALDVFEAKNHNPSTDIDCLVFLGKNLGLCEIKSDRLFDFEQTKVLLRTGDIMNAKFIVLSSLISDTNPALQDFFSALSDLNYSKPIFILTREALFAPEPFDFSRLLEIMPTNRNKFYSGPFIISQQKKVPFT